MRTPVSLLVFLAALTLPVPSSAKGPAPKLDFSKIDFSKMDLSKFTAEPSCNGINCGGRTTMSPQSQRLVAGYRGRRRALDDDALLGELYVRDADANADADADADMGFGDRIPARRIRYACGGKTCPEVWQRPTERPGVRGPWTPQNPAAPINLALRRRRALGDKLVEALRVRDADAVADAEPEADFEEGEFWARV